MGNHNIIELNGQQYNALTGAIVKPNSLDNKNHANSKNMDGFSRPPKKPLSHHKTEKSKTLMRTAVSKPKHAKPNTHKNSIKTFSTTPKTRLNNAKTIGLSPLVSKFGSINDFSIKHTARKSVQHAKTGINNVLQHANSPIDPIANAIANAPSIDTNKLKKLKLNKKLANKLHVSTKFINSAMFMISFLLLFGFFTYQNIPGLSMRLAANRSGVAGSIPKYQPAGFNLNGAISYKVGQIEINYKSKSDQRNFKITQSNSAWDSQSLLNNYVSIDRKDYQTIQDKGKTVYLYNNNATWVDGGIWYRIEGESKLNSRQLLDIASSL